MNDNLIEEARRPKAIKKAEMNTWIQRLADALEVAEKRATEAEAERDEFKRLFAECHPIHRDGVQRAYVAEKELRDRELHHFEVEQELVAALAVIEKARSLHYPHENTIHTEPALVCAHRHCVDDAGDQVAWPCPTGRTLSSVPADVLRERDADRWDECVQEAFDLGWLHEHAAKEMRARNPYRQTEEENSNG